MKDTEEARFRKLSPAARRMVVLQLAVMLNSGVSIVKALETLANAEDDSVRRFGLAVLLSVSVGYPLTESIAKATNQFSKAQLSLLETGENTGKLALVLMRLSDQMEKELSLRRQLLGALTYPLGIVVLTGLMTLFIVNFMLPPLLSAAGAALKNPPLPTRILTSFAEQGALITTLTVVLLCSIPWLYSSVPQAQTLRKWLLYDSPVLGRLASNIELAGLTRELSLMLHTGFSISRAVTNLQPSNPRMEQCFAKTLHSLSAGCTLAESFADAGEFEAGFLAVIEVGEETGRLASTLQHQADYLEVNAQQDIQDIVKLVEPTIMIVLGLLVAFVLIGTLMPVYQVAAHAL